MENIAALAYEWDPAQNTANREKRGLAFEEAIEAFSDPDGIYIREQDNFRFIGRLAENPVLIDFAEKIQPGIRSVRIIAARKACENEAELYRRYCRSAGPAEGACEPAQSDGDFTPGKYAVLRAKDMQAASVAASFAALQKKKETVTISLDSDIVEYFRSKGDSCQNLINSALRAFMEQEKAGHMDGG